MKSFFLAFLILLLTTTAFAAGGEAFVPYSATGAKTLTSGAYRVQGNPLKSIVVTGIKNPANPTTFKNMSGTLTAECGPSTNGPWATCIANDYAQTTVSRTTSGAFTWNDAINYVRLKWVTTGNTRNYIKAWLNWN